MNFESNEENSEIIKEFDKYFLKQSDQTSLTAQLIVLIEALVVTAIQATNDDLSYSPDMLQLKSAFLLLLILFISLRK